MSSTVVFLIHVWYGVFSEYGYSIEINNATISAVWLMVDVSWEIIMYRYGTTKSSILVMKINRDNNAPSTTSLRSDEMD